MTETSREDLTRMMHVLVDRANARILGGAQPAKVLRFAEGTRNDRYEQLRAKHPFPGCSEFGLLDYDDIKFEIEIHGETEVSEADCRLTLWFPAPKRIRSIGGAGFNELCSNLCAVGVQLCTTLDESPGRSAVAYILGVQTRCLLASDGRSLCTGIYNLRQTAQNVERLFFDWEQLGVTTP